MSSTRSNSPATMDSMEEPQKKGARSGKRSVSHLSKAQLARKRLNDRESQRNIRQRTREHIESLEHRVEELLSQAKLSNRRNAELEAEVEELKGQIAVLPTTVVPTRLPSQIQEEPLIAQKGALGWTPKSASHLSWEAHLARAQAHSPNTTNTTYPFTDVASFSQTANQTGVNETSQTLYTAASSIAPTWDDPLTFEPQVAPPLFHHTAYSRASLFQDPQAAKVSNMSGISTYQTTTSWQNQPSVHAWRLSTCLKAPATHLDRLMFDVIQSQRHLSITDDLTGEELLGPAIPSVHILFSQPGPLNKTPTRLNMVMESYSNVLSVRGFQLIPEKLASFMCMYRFIQWQISPCHETYQLLHPWQVPEQSQLDIPHPAWMDLVPWGKFRDKIIRNQDRYDNAEFQGAYATNLSVNFSSDTMKALIFDGAQIKISPFLDAHLSDIRNVSMRRPFAEKYPEFSDVCRFDEV